MESLYRQGAAIFPSSPQSLLTAYGESWLYAQPFRLAKYRWIKVKPHMYSQSYFNGAMCVTDVNQLPLGCQTYDALNRQYHSDCARMYLMQHLYYRQLAIVQADIICGKGQNNRDIASDFEDFFRVNRLSLNAKQCFRACMTARRERFGYQPLKVGAKQLSSLTQRLLKWIAHLCDTYRIYEDSAKVRGCLTRYLQRALNYAFHTTSFDAADFAYLIAYASSYLIERTCHRGKLADGTYCSQIECRILAFDAAFRNHTHVSRIVDSLQPIHCDETLPDIISQHTEIIGEGHLITMQQQQVSNR